MKKIITILLLGCLCLNITGYHVIFQLRKSALKLAMKRMLRRQTKSQDELVFNFPLYGNHNTEMPEWEEEDEFRLKGKMYDVIEKKIENGRWVVRCISDERETELIEKYQKVLEKQFGNRAKKRSASLLKLIVTPYTLPSIINSSFLITILHNSFPILRCSLSTACLEVITPPPRIA